ncbi:hypothetical protein CSE16_06200 [Solibacillus sp. R5-41]|uniref:YpoC family protein n=1 Tax=Solibacillus sp. R5-41 TaxID=2048654 RepID=UPI000C125874|nr:hypothetical protein [Solibacillus sp. R5-41]ATP39676.1 hypothetical protein CSE16_06200 [Solibacillus sp. R5-41]
MIAVNKAKISKEAVNEWYESWEQLQQKIHIAHDARDSSVQQLMQRAIEQFEHFIVTSSESSTAFSETAPYEMMPINGMERLSFVKMRPGQYAAYRQLDELYKETKKRCARLRL